VRAKKTKKVFWPAVAECDDPVREIPVYDIDGLVQRFGPVRF